MHRGPRVSKIVNKNKNGSITLFSFDKGQNLSEHSAPFDAVVLVLEGTCEIRIGGEPNAIVGRADDRHAGQHPARA